MNSDLLPSSWTQCVLGEVVDTIRGVSYAKEQASDRPKDGYVPILRATNIDQQIHFEDFVFVPGKQVSAEQMLKMGDIVIAASSGSKSVVGKAAQLFQDWGGSFGAFCMGIRPNAAIEPRFVGHFFQSHEYRNRVSTLAAGSNINNLKRDHIESFPFRLAPLEEQRRVSDKIDELFSDLDAGVAALERVRVNLKRYRAAVLKAAVEGKLTEEWREEHPNVEPASKLLERILAERRRKWEETQLGKFAAAGKAPPKGWEDNYPEPVKPDTTNLPNPPEGWCWASVDQLAYWVRNGLPQKPAADPPGLPILRINAVRPMSVDVGEVRYLHVAREDVADYLLAQGDLLFTRYNGSLELLGVSGMVRNCERDTLHPDKLIRVRTALASPLPAYVEVASNVGISRKFIQTRARTTAGQTGVSGSDIKEMPIPLCPLDEQKLIVEEVEVGLDTIGKSLSDIEMGIERATRLRQAILKRAFEGKLVPQDPKDEPASVLLERIRASRSEARPAKNGTKRAKSKSA
jgi:type I restriction enzyme, S subunit